MTCSLQNLILSPSYRVFALRSSLLSAASFGVQEPQLVLRGKDRNARRAELRLHPHTRSRLRAIKLVDGVELSKFPRIHTRVQI